MSRPAGSRSEACCNWCSISPDGPQRSRGQKAARYNKRVGFRALAVAVLVCVALPVRAQQSVKLQFSGGQVTLSAQNAPVRSILAEWARLGGATIVNGDRVAGPPVTLELSGVPERQALDIVLRSAAGYMLAPRPAGSAGASAFDRILILPTSVAPRNPPPPSAAPGGRPAVPRPPVIARPPEASLEPPVEDSQDDNTGEPNPQGTQSPFTGDPRRVAPPVVRRPPLPRATEPNGGAGEPDDADEQAPAQKGVAPTPTNPFGIPFGSSATPGVVSPAPPPQQRPAPNRVQ